jgi:acyl carrier protein
MARSAGDLGYMDIRQRLKQVIVEDLNLEETTPEQIRDDEALFGEGIGLDSLDAVELVVVIKKRFGVEIKDMTEGRQAFASIDSLARFIAERMQA